MPRYITAEQFMQQPQNVQNVIRKWWEPQVGDIFTTEQIHDEIDAVINISSGKYIHGLNDVFFSNMYPHVDLELKPFPLLTMQQLIEFIEWKIEMSINEIERDVHRGEWNINLLNGIDYMTEQTDLLQALWEVACKVVK